MGSPFVSKAPRGPSGRSEKDVPPLLGALALRLPPRLRLRADGSGALVFVGRWPAGAPLVLCPILLVLSSLSWVGPEPLDGPRVLVSALGWCATLLLGWRCWPRRAQLTLRPATRQLIIGRETAGQIVTLPETLRWLLTVEHPPELPQPRYRALLLHDQRHWPLLGNEDPAQLLRDLGRVLARWPGQVEQEWQLSSEAQPWLCPPGALSPNILSPNILSPSTLPPNTLSPEPDPPVAIAPEAGARALQGSRADRTLRLSMLIMTMLVVLDLTYLVLSAGARVATVHPLSVALALLAGACLITISASVLTRHPSLVLGSLLAQEHSVLGLRRVRHRVHPQSVRGVYVLGSVSSSGAARRCHLLVDSSEGSLALLVESKDAEALRQELLRQLQELPAAASESIVSAPRRWQSG